MNSTTAPVWCKVPKFEIAKDLKLDIPAYGWTDCGCGWEGREHRIRLGTWKLARRCIFIRRPNVQKSAAIPPERAQLPAPDGSS